MNTKDKDIKMLAVLRKSFGRDGKTNTQLDKIMNIFFDKGYIGAMPYDEYPMNKKGESYAIVNTDNKKGVHWLACYRDKNKVDRLVPDFCTTLKGNGFQIIQSNHNVDQGEKAQDCGLRSVSWLLCCKNLGVTEAMTI
jgi:hypothetical protein